MSEWVEDNLGHLANIEIGGTPSRDVPAFWANENANGHPWVSIADLGPRYVAATKERITGLGVLSSNVKLVRRGTLLMSFKLTIGRAGIANVDLFTNEAIAAVVPEQKTLDSGFLYYLLPPIACGAVTDTAIKGSTLNKQTLARLKLSFPKDVRQQRRIAEILSTVDEAIEQTEALIAKYQQIKAGLMQDLFTRGLFPEASAKGDVTWKLRPTRTQAPHLYKESPLGWIPKEWESGGVEKYLIQSAGMKPGPFGSSLTKSVYTESGYRVYGQEQILANSLAEGDYYVSASKWVELRDFAVAEGDILMTLVGVGTTGKVLVVREPFEPGIINPRVMRLRPNKIACSIEFLRQLISSSLVRSQFNRFATGGTMPVLNASVVRMVRVPIVPITEQQLIASVLSSHDARLAIERKLYQKLLCQKHGLMHDLLTGRVRVKVAEAKASV